MRKTMRYQPGIAILLLLCSLLASWPSAAQTNTPSLQSIVTITGNDVSLLQIFRAIKKQTGLTLVYNNQLLNDGEKVSLNFQQAKLNDVLSFIFRNKNINYVLQRNRIVLDKKEVAAPTPAAAVATSQESQDAWLVRGLVMDPDGNPLPGATISLNEGQQGTVTDVMGVFSIKAKKDDLLKVGMMGMNPELVKVTSQKALKVTLTAKVDKLNEVVVVGFGNQKKVTVTGAVSTVNMADMKTPTISLTNALVGKVAGVISMQSGGGEPGYDNPNFTIRGVGTFAGSTSPLIIVDGVQREDVNSTYGGAFNNIDPEDIQSISLLKDASATAVYGAKGANGVLIITTKKGVAGKPKVSAKAESGFSGFTRMPEMVDGVNYMKLYNEALVNSGSKPVYTDEIIKKTESGLDPYVYPNVNWINTVYKKWATMANANVNVSGGGEAMRYYVSMSFYNQDGQYNVKKLNDYNPNLNFKRYDFRSNIDLNVTKTTLLSLNLASMLVNSRFPGYPAGGIWYATYATNPIAFPVQFPDGKLSGPINNGGNNPYNMVQNSGYSVEFKPSIQSVMSLNQKLDAIADGLSANVRFSFDTYSEFDNSRKGTPDLYSARGRNLDGTLNYQLENRGITYLNFGSSSSGERMMYLEGNLNYDRSFGRHNIGALLVGSIRNRLRGSAGDLKTSIPFRNQNTAARVTYSFMDKYLAEVNMGATGSENFAPGKRWGYFPAAAVGYVISKEPFFDAISQTITLLKVRASYGVTGNDQINGDRFGYLTYYSGGTGISFGSSLPAYTGGIVTSVIGTENLTWEKSAKTNIGIDIGLLNKFSLVVDVFRDKRTNILVPRSSISPIGGYSEVSIYGNIGEMDNRGFDASLEYNTQIGKDVTLRVFGNITYAKNKIVFADRPKAIYDFQESAGRMYGEIIGYKNLGLFVSDDDVEKSPMQLRTVSPGDIKYYDWNKDGVIDANDQGYLGKSTFPKWSYGFGFNLGYKRFELSAIFAGVQDVAIMANGEDTKFSDYGVAGVGIIPFTGMGQYPSAVISDVLNRWTTENPSQNVHYPRLNIANTSDNNYVASDWWLRDGSFMRLKQATLSYSFITPAMKRKNISNLQVYVGATNMLTFSKFKLWDPELGNNAAKYPFAKTGTVGLRAQF